MNNLIKIIEKRAKEFNEKFANGGNYLCLKSENQKTSCSEDVKSFHLSSFITLLEGVGKEIEGMKIKEKGTVRLDYTNGKKYEVEVEVESDRQIFYNQALSDLLSFLKEAREGIEKEL